MDTTTTAPVGKMVPVTFSAKVGAVTKVSLTPDAGDTSFTSAWEDGDGMKLSYENANDSDNKGIVDASYDAANSKWSANLPTYKGMWSYVASYPAASAIPFGAARTQTGNAYNPAYDIMQGEFDVLDADAGKDDVGKDIVFPMERLTAIQYFHFTSDLDEKVYSATLSVGNSDDNIAATTVNINGSGALVVASGGAKSITLTFPVGSEPTANDFKLWFNVLPSGFTSMSIDIETASHTKHIERDLSGSLGMGVYEAGKLYKVKGTITDWTLKDKVFLEERWSETKGTGGNDLKWSGSIASSSIVYDGSDWTLNRGGGAKSCIKLGTSSNIGSATTPSIEVSAPYRSKTLKLSFKSGAWSGDATTLKLSAENATLSSSSVTLKNKADGNDNWDEHTIDITVTKSPITISFEGNGSSNSRFFLDDVCVYYGTKPTEGSSGGASKTVTYTVTSKTAVSTSGTAPAGSSATYSQTYDGAAKQMTGGNSITLTLSNYTGKTIKAASLSMHSNKSSGAGGMTFKSGSRTIASVANSTAFSNSAWNGAWSQEYVDVELDVTETTVASAEDVVLNISASKNSLFFESITITYE